MGVPQDVKIANPDDEGGKDKDGDEDEDMADTGQQVETVLASLPPASTLAGYRLVRPLGSLLSSSAQKKGER